VDAALGDTEQLDELGVTRQPHLEPRCAQADVPERCDVQRSRSGWPSMLSSAMSRRKKSPVVQSATTRSFRGFTGWFVTRSYHLYQLPLLTRKLRVVADWTTSLFFRRDIAELSMLGHPDRLGP
jgi:hypothetical protein